MDMGRRGQGGLGSGLIDGQEGQSIQRQKPQGRSTRERDLGHQPGVRHAELRRRARERWRWGPTWLSQAWQRSRGRPAPGPEEATPEAKAPEPQGRQGPGPGSGRLSLEGTTALARGASLHLEASPFSFSLSYDVLTSWGPWWLGRPCRSRRGVNSWRQKTTPHPQPLPRLTPRCAGAHSPCSKPPGPGATQLDALQPRGHGVSQTDGASPCALCPSRRSHSTGLAPHPPLLLTCLVLPRLALSSWAPSPGNRN